MQIDFHYDVIYILSRIIGYNNNLSLRIAKSSQYIDDSTEPGKIKDVPKIVTSHKNFNHLNLRIEDQIKIWMPFHFPPGFKGKNLFEKSIVQPDSYSIDRMQNSLKEMKQKKYFPEYLGIFLHMLADSFSHQGFSSFLSNRNDLTLINGHLPYKWINYLPDFIKNYIFVLIKFLPVGHLTVNTNPDLPYRKWSFKTDRMPEEKNINNIERYESALKKIKDFLILNCPETYNDEEFKQKKIISKILSLSKKLNTKNPNTRHKKWQQKIMAGYFGFTPNDNISYSKNLIKSDTEFLINFHKAAKKYKDYFHKNVTDELFKQGLDERIFIKD